MACVAKCTTERWDRRGAHARLGRGGIGEQHRARRRHEVRDRARLGDGAGQARERWFAREFRRRRRVGDEQHRSGSRIRLDPLVGELQDRRSRNRVKGVPLDQVAAPRVAQRRERHVQDRAVRHDREPSADRAWQVPFDGLDEQVVELAPRRIPVPGECRGRANEFGEPRRRHVDRGAADRAVRRDDPHVHCVAADPVHDHRRMQAGGDRPELVGFRGGGDALAADRGRRATQRQRRHLGNRLRASEIARGQEIQESARSRELRRFERFPEFAAAELELNGQRVRRRPEGVESLFEKILGRELSVNLLDGLESRLLAGQRRGLISEPQLGVGQMQPRVQAVDRRPLWTEIERTLGRGSERPYSGRASSRSTKADRTARPGAVRCRARRSPRAGSAPAPGLRPPRKTRQDWRAGTRSTERTLFPRRPRARARSSRAP